MNLKAIIYTIGIIVLIVNLLYYKSTGKFFKNGLIGVLSGEIALGIVYVVSKFYDLGVAVNPFTIAASGLLGIPGVILMIVFMCMTV